MKTTSVHLVVVVLLAVALVPMAYAQPPGMGRGRGRGLGGGTAQDQVKYHRLMADLIEAAQPPRLAQANSVDSRTELIGNFASTPSRACLRCRLPRSAC